MQQQLRDGLILRSISEGVESDRANMGKFYAEVFGEEGEEDAPALEGWTHDLLSDEHPQTTADDFWVVVDPAKEDKIVSAVLLIPQTWSYYGVQLGMGRVELVATHKDYRHRGLVRALFDAAHARSAELGHVMQGVTGIPHYYRRFGYTMAVDLGGRARMPMAVVPKRKDDEKPKYTFRRATDADIPNLLKWDEGFRRKFTLSTVYNADMWRFELNHRSKGTPMYKHVHIISNQSGEDVGYIVLQASDYWSMTRCSSYVLDRKASYLDTIDDVLRYMKSFAENYYADHEKDAPNLLGFDDNMPPVFNRMVTKMGHSRTYETLYAWYLRVPDLPKLIKTIAPVLEKRLEDSDVNGYTGNLSVHSFSKTATTIKFENGCITDVTEDVLHPEWKADAAFPNHTFLNVLFGHRSPDELVRTLPEVFVNRKATVLFDALFPLHPSSILPIA